MVRGSYLGAETEAAGLNPGFGRLLAERLEAGYKHLLACFFIHKMELNVAGIAIRLRFSNYAPAEQNEVCD